MLSFRLIDAELRPLANRGFVCRIEKSGSATELTTEKEYTTNREGRAVTEHDPSEPDEAITLRVYARSPSGGLRALVELPALVSGRKELGDVVLAAARLLVSGRVVQSQGEPVSAGRVHVEALVDGNWSLSTIIRELEPDGTFALYDDPPAGALRLRVRPSGHTPSDYVSFSPGDRGLVVQVPD